MKTLDKAIKTFGFEHPITITISVLEEQGKTELAEQLYKECKELAYPHGMQDDDEEGDPAYEYEDWEDDADETGFDPYEGCYTFDC